MSARYTPDARGFREFMNSQTVGSAMRSVADDMASQVNQQGRGDYEARNRTVQGGRRADDRAGAEVVEARRDWGDVRRRRLVNLSRQFTMRGGG